LFGHYRNFPLTAHGIARFRHPSIKKVQEATVKTLHQLNKETHSLSELAFLDSSKCEVGFDFGIAEDVTFTYIDEEELNKVKKRISRNTLQILDFLCIIKYHHVEKGGKRIPLKFDYYFIRFAFNEKDVELRVYHERGTQRIPIEDLMRFIIKRISRELSRRRLEPLALYHLWAL